MPSSSRPYKSKLLRFVLQQWQQGLERQDRAWRQLQSTATWGAQVVIFPIYAIMRAVERASFVLDSGSGNPTAHSEQTPAREHVTDIEHSMTAILTHTQQLLSSEQKRQLAIMPEHSFLSQARYLLSRLVDQIEQQFTDNLPLPGQSSSISRRQSESLKHKTHHRSGHLTPGRTAVINHRNTSALLQNGVTLASSLRNQKLMLVNLKNEVFDIFTPEQQSNLQYYIARIINAYEQSRGQAKKIVTQQSQRLSVQTILAIEGRTAAIEQSRAAILTHTQQLLSTAQQGQLALTPTNSLIHPAKDPRSINHKGTSDLVQNGTTLASSIKTRQLVLVNIKNEVFDIFSPEQQADLKRYISRVMYAYRQSRTMVPRQAKPLSPKTILAIGVVFVAALPSELKKAWSQIAPGPKSPSLPPIASSGPQPRSRVLYPSATAARSHRLSSQSATTNNTRRLSSKDPHAFEADVNDVSYMEHPLERILRWLDHVLTWCERRWQRWLEHRANIG